MKNNFYIDTEFLEGSQDKRIFGVKAQTVVALLGPIFFVTAVLLNTFTQHSLGHLGAVIVCAGSFGLLVYARTGFKTPPTIDVISIAIVAKDGRELYMFSKEFNLKEAWERFEIKEGYNHGDMRNSVGDKWHKKVYWIRENVLKTLWKELAYEDFLSGHEATPTHIALDEEYFKKPYAERVEEYYDNFLTDKSFTYNEVKRLINEYGNTREEIARAIKMFVGSQETVLHWEKVCRESPIRFYSYFADYDWVAFCWIFGKMIDLPKGYPMYCIDLKQNFDEVAQVAQINVRSKVAAFTDHTRYIGDVYETTFEDMKRYLVQNKQYPLHPILKHSALADALWNIALHEFLEHIMSQQSKRVSVKAAVEVLQIAFKEDLGFRTSYEANIAMSFKDLCEYQTELDNGIKVEALTPEYAHVLSNKAAKNFIDKFIEV